MPRFRLLAGFVLAPMLIVTGCQSAPAPAPPPPSATHGAYACPPGDLLVESPPVDQGLLDTQVVSYSELCRNHARITISTASDGGRTSFVNGLVQIAAADSTLDAEQAEKARVRCLDHPAWHLPTATDPVALVHRVDGVDQLALSPATLAKIFSGVITHWNDPAIAAENSAAELPAARIHVIARAGQTGTTKALSDYLHREAPDSWPANGVESWRGQGERRDSPEQVIEAVRTTPFSLGYAEYSALPQETTTPTPTPSPSPTPSPTPTPTADATGTPGTPAPNGTPGSATPTPTPTPTPSTIPGPVPPRLVKLIREGAPVALTAETAQQAVAGITAGPGPDLPVDAGSLAADPAGWPIQRVTYQILCSAGLRPEWTALEKDWIGYVLSDETQERLTATGRIPLPAEFRERVRASLDAVR